ncbi:MAG: hypothetical protein KDC35_12035 [Acidobacteria bacterium]|nr:hypothetical protein [Acidobacteriota bacterium]
MHHKQTSTLHKTRTAHLLQRISCVVILALIAVFTSLRPVNNWDSVAYTACLLRLSGTPETELRGATYERIKESVDGQTFYQLIAGPIRSTTYQDDQAFREAIQLHQNRFAYIGFASLLHQIGLHPVRSLYLASWLMGVAGMMLLGVTFASKVDAHMQFAFVLGLLFSGVIPVLHLATPDAAAFLGWALIAWFYSRRKSGLFLLAPLLPLLRPDMILASMLILVSVGYRPGCRLNAGLSMLSSLGVFWVLQTLSGSPGWSVYFHHAFIHMTPYPVSHGDSFGWTEYLRAVAHGVLALEIKLSIALVIFLGVMRVSWVPLKNHAAGLVYACVFYTCLHFLFFPTGEARFYAGPLTLIIGCLVNHHVTNGTFGDSRLSD